MQIAGIVFSTTAAFFWASAVIMFKKSSEQITPAGLNLFKCVVTLILLIPTLLVFNVPFFPDLDFQTYLKFCLSGLLGITLADTFFFMALSRIGAGLWAIVDCLYLPCIIFMSYIFLGESLGVKGLVGAGLVASAIVTGSLSTNPRQTDRKKIVSGLFFGVMAVIMVAASIVMVKTLLNETHVLWASFIRIVAGVAGLVVISWVHPQRKRILKVFIPSGLWKITLPGSIVGNYFAMLAWIAGMKYTLVSLSAILNQLATIFTFILAAVFLKERITKTRLVAIITAVAGALLAASTL